MKICFFNTGYLPSRGGVATFSYEWVENSAKIPEVKEVRVLAFGNPVPRIEKRRGFRLRAMKTRNFFAIGACIGWYFLKYFRYDFFHATNLFPVGFWTVIYSKIFRKKCAVTFYGTDACSTKASRLAFAAIRWTLTHADIPVTISNFTKQETEKKYALEKDFIKVIYPGCPQASLDGEGGESSEEAKEQIIGKYKIEPDDFVVLTIAQLVKRKGIDILVRAITDLHDPKIKLFVIGSGRERAELEKLIKNEKMERQINLVGKVDSVIPYYRIGKMLVLNSYYVREQGDFEGLGLVLLEAQSYGLPVIGTNSGGIPEAIDIGRTGFVIPERDIDALKKALLRLKNDKNLYESMSRRTKDFLQEKFNWTRAMEEYRECIKGVKKTKQ